MHRIQMNRTNTKCTEIGQAKMNTGHGQGQGQSAQDKDNSEKPHVTTAANTNGRDEHKSKMHRTNTKYTNCIEQIQNILIA